MRRPAMASIPGVIPMNPDAPRDQYDPLGIGQTRRQGFFGRLGGAIRGDGKRDWGNVLGTLGAAMQQMDGGSELNDYLARREDAQSNRDLFNMRGRALKLEEAEAERVRAETEAAISTLDPSIQPWARLAPNAAAARALAPPEQPDYQIDAQGRPYTIQGGRVQYGEGQVAVPPRGGTGGGAPPSGYRFTPDGNLEAIPGGPADVRASAEGRSRAAQMDASVRSLTNALGAIDQAERNISGWTTGLAGQVAGNVGGSGAFNLDQALEPVRAVLSFETLAEMRRNSQTGGALGSIAVRELELLGNTMRSLNIGQSASQLRENLSEIRAQMRRTIEAINAARAEVAADATAAPAQGTPEGERVLRWNPTTGQLE